MSGPNTTGLANPADYHLGRGRLYLALLSATTQLVVGGWRDVGNVPDFQLTPTTSTLDHFSSRAGVKVLDKQVLISEDLDCSFMLDEINNENLATFFIATQVTVTNAAVAGFTQWLLVPDGDLALGRWYDLRTTAGLRAYNVNAADVAVASDEGTPVTYVLNTDYTVDTVTGRIFILSTSTKAATTIAATKGLNITLTAKASAGAVQQVRAYANDAVIVAAKFVAINEANNSLQTEFEFHRLSLKPDGAFSLITDQMTQMGFKAKAEQNPLKSPLSPTMTITTIATQS